MPNPSVPPHPPHPPHDVSHPPHPVPHPPQSSHSPHPPQSAATVPLQPPPQLLHPEPVQPSSPTGPQLGPMQSKLDPQLPVTQQPVPRAKSPTSIETIANCLYIGGILSLKMDPKGPCADGAARHPLRTESVFRARAYSTRRFAVRREYRPHDRQNRDNLPSRHIFSRHEYGSDADRAIHRAGKTAPTATIRYRFSTCFGNTLDSLPSRISVVPARVVAMRGRSGGPAESRIHSPVWPSRRIGRTRAPWPGGMSTRTRGSGTASGHPTCTR